MLVRVVVWSGICVFALACGLLPGLAQPPVERVPSPAERVLLATHYQLGANDMSWTWQDEEATPEYCAAELREDGPYHVEIVYRNRWQRTIRIRDEKDALRYEIQGRAHTTFYIDGDMLYYADYRGSGTAVVAVNLTTHTERWRTHLRGVGPSLRDSYWNRVVVRAYQGVVAVRGLEDGKYIEYLDAATGHILAHRIFNEPVGEG